MKTKKSTDHDFRSQLVAYLKQGYAHMSLDEAVKDFPMDRINEQAPNTDYTPYRLLFHIQKTQWDIVDFVRNPEYQSISWPDDYWPLAGQKATKADWDKTIRTFNKDLADFIKIVADPKVDLNRKIPWGTGQTILKEAFVIIDHNSYHIGEFGILRSVMKTWK